MFVCVVLFFSNYGHIIFILRKCVIDCMLNGAWPTYRIVVVVVVTSTLASTYLRRALLSTLEFM